MLSPTDHQLFLALVLLLGSGTTAELFPPYAEEQAFMFYEHKRAFSTSLPSKKPLLEATLAEDVKSFQNFLAALKLADARNAQELEDGGASGWGVHGPTKFSSLSQSEFERLYLQDQLPQISSYLARAVDSPLADPAAALEQDWVGNLTTPVRNQGDCGAGWAFAAAAQIESDAQRTLGVRHVLSPQQLLACDELHGEYCDGGWPEAAYAYTRRAGGLEREATYPYISADGAEPSCTAKANNFVVNAADVGASSSLQSTPYGGSSPGYAISRESAAVTELAMAYHVANVGPLTVCLDATKFSTYVGGVLSVCGEVANHCVQIVGIHKPQQQQQQQQEGGGGGGGGGGKIGWWRVKNSFGTDWGEGGYARIRFGRNTCGVTTRPTFTVPSYAESLLRQAPDSADFPSQTTPQLTRRYRQV